MKYIRTKDGVYELKVNEELKSQKVDNYFYTEHKQYNCNLLYSKQDLKKFSQADTIEELCDYVVSMNELCDVPIVEELPHEMGNDKHFISNVKFQTLQGQHGKWWVKLAITTDKGLIYVAKMNDKGELELL